MSLFRAVFLVILLLAFGFAGALHGQSNPNDAPPASGQPKAALPAAGEAGKPQEQAPQGPAIQTKTAPSPAPEKNVFQVKYVSDGAVYLDAGRNAGLVEGMLLHVVHADPGGGTTEAVRFQGVPPIADIRIFSIADTSSAAEIVRFTEDLNKGDIAYLDVSSVHQREETKNSAESENYPVLTTFSYGDPLDEELRTKNSPASKELTEGNQLRGRIGFDTGMLTEPGGFSSRQVGMLVQADMSQIGGTHWDLRGYYRGMLNTQNLNAAGGTPPQTLNDLMNRTYHLYAEYQNPDSVVVMGFGRLYLPYATSLSTIDGGYFGYKFSQRWTAGVFGGSTPDPTSWSYNPNQQIAGNFVNYQAGDFEHMRISSTAGLAMTSIAWHVARQFAFAENNFSIGHTFSIYNSLQFDKGRTALQNQTYSTGLTQSFTSVRYQPIKLLTFDLNHNYLVSLPTFDPALISLGLLDQYLFQGFSGGATVDLPYHVSLSTDLGRSKSSSDKANALNQMYGITFGEIAKTGLHVDLRYTKFNSSFGLGDYEYVSVSRGVSDKLHVSMQAGTQHLTSTYSTNSDSRFITGTADWSLGSRFFLEGLYTWNMGTTMNYTQMDFTFGYRFGGFKPK